MIPCVEEKVIKSCQYCVINLFSPTVVPALESTTATYCIAQNFDR